MKVGTDGVLLGAWFPVESGMSVLDIGTGTGLIALMAAQRGAGRVTAVEIDSKAAEQAAHNVSCSEWADKIDVISCDIAGFNSQSGFDRIVSNPPYFRDSLRCPDSRRSAARHNDSLSFETLALRSAGLLADNGLLCLVLPYDAVDAFVKCAVAAGLCLCGRTNVFTVPGKAPKRSLVAFGKSYMPLLNFELSIYDSNGNETVEYIKFVKNFYLKY